MKIKLLRDINKIKLKKIFLLTFILILISLLLSCQNIEGIEIKRINLFSTKYLPNESIGEKEVYPKDYTSFIFYRKYYIYFFDNSTKTLYKYSRNGSSVLIIQNSSMTYSGFGVDKEKMMASLDESQRTVKINRSFPLPEVTGLSVDFNDNIYLKVVIKGTSGNPKEDLSGFLSNYSDKNHPIYYLLKNEDAISLIDRFNFIENISQKSNIIDNSQIRYYTFYMVFNPYGDFIKILALSESHPSFPHNSFIYHTKEDLSEGTNKDGKKLDGISYIHFILPTIYENTGLPSALANTTSTAYFIKFSLKSSEEDTSIMNFPNEMNIINNTNNEPNKTDNISSGIQEVINQAKTDEKAQIYDIYYNTCPNSSYISFNLTDLIIPENNENLLSSEFGSAIVTPDGYIAIQVYYYEKGYILYDAIYKISFLDKKNRVVLNSYKKLFNEKVENGVQKITLSSVDTCIGGCEGNFIFYIRYLEKLPTPTAKLIIKNEKGEEVIVRIMKVKDILTTENMVVGENGSIYGFSKVKDKIYFFYYASEVAISKAKTQN
ncbi:MAG TPA: hypothetical protein PLF21_01530 [Exilispira sp.]|nr:hypothetical protein [Exilispira sp.]